MVYDSLTQSPFLDFVHRHIKKATFRKPVLLRSSGEEAPNLVDPLDITILSLGAIETGAYLKQCDASVVRSD